MCVLQDGNCYTSVDYRPRNVHPADMVILAENVCASPVCEAQSCFLVLAGSCWKVITTARTGYQRSTLANKNSNET